MLELGRLNKCREIGVKEGYCNESVALRHSANPSSGSQNGIWKIRGNLVVTIYSSSLFSF